MQNSIQKELIELKNSKEWIDFEKYYKNYNIFNQFDFIRYEDIHTSILKSLFIQENAYGLYTYPLEKLIELLIIKDSSKVQINIEDLNKFNIENINIKTQEIIDNNRLDLLIEFKINNNIYNIILENKILSKEHDNQCQRYYEYFKNNKNNNIFVYLSLEINPDISCKDKYICINYQELINYVIEPCSYKCINNNNNVISLYHYLASFCKLFDDACLSNEDRIIPITRYGKELTHNLEEKYGNLLIKQLKDGTQFYRLNQNILYIYYYILNIISEDTEIKSLIKKKVLKIKCKFNNVNCSYKECSLKILKYLIDNKIIVDKEDLDKLNDCLYDKNYIAATLDYERIKNKEKYYTKDKKNIGKLYFNGSILYYYDYYVTGEELKYYIKNINEKFDNVLENIVEIN